jgi:hypothetical protein
VENQKWARFKSGELIHTDLLQKMMITRYATHICWADADCQKAAQYRLEETGCAHLGDGLKKS